MLVFSDKLHFRLWVYISVFGLFPRKMITFGAFGPQIFFFSRVTGNGAAFNDGEFLKDVKKH